MKNESSPQVPPAHIAGGKREVPRDHRIPMPYLRWGAIGGFLRAVMMPVLALWIFASFDSRATGAGPIGDWARYSVMTPAGRPEPPAALFKNVNTLLYANHKLEQGEWNMWALAKKYGTTMPSLQATNNSELILLNPGATLMIHNKDGLLYWVKHDSESLDSIIAKYQKDPAKARKLKEKVVEINGLPGAALLGPYRLSKSETLLLPGVRVNFDTYGFPFQDRSWARISSRFGNRFHPILKTHRMHEGLDLPKPYGTKVYPSRSGRVIYAGWEEGYGNAVEIAHADQERTLYGHLSKIDVTVGQWVASSRTLIGRVGSTGLSTGPHLHFEVRDRYGKPMNPLKRLGRR